MKKGFILKFLTLFSPFLFSCGFILKFLTLFSPFLFSFNHNSPFLDFKKILFSIVYLKKSTDKDFCI